MFKFAEMDDKITIFDQMDGKGGPVILINKFNVDPDETEQLLENWTKHANFFKQQPGYISTQFHRGIGGSSVFINYEVWESIEDYKNAVNQKEALSILETYPPSTVISPHLFTKVAVHGICVK